MDALNDMERILGPEGPVARRLGEGYEPRSQQLEMASGVADAFARSHNLIAEAGTGTGKSFAYLIPAILHAVGGADETGPRKRVVVSTHTIALQEQLFEKDLPFLRSILPHEFSAVLVKGRSNYVSLRRLQRAMDARANLFEKSDDLLQLEELAEWTAQTQDGSRTSLPLIPSPAVWDEVVSDRDDCMGRACPRYKECFYQQARERALKADILVVNHALFFANMGMGGMLLPPHDAVVLDEAHAVEHVAGSWLGPELTNGRFSWFFSRLQSGRRNKGLLPALRDKINEDLYRRAVDALADARAASDGFFADWLFWLDQHAPRNGRIREPHVVDGERLACALDALGLALRRIALPLEESDRQAWLKMTGQANRAQEFAGTLRLFCEQRLPDAAYWAEKRDGRGRIPQVILRAIPVDLAPILREELFEKKNNQDIHIPVVLTSATLSVPDKVDGFSLLRERLGCDSASGLKLSSPFDYTTQATLVAGRQLPQPGPAPSAEGEARLIEVIRAEILRSGGGAFILFTSHAQLRRFHDHLAHDALPGALLAQGIHGEARQLLERFKHDGNAILLGTDSFWQGVDVPGRALRLVVMMRLPFAVPDQPLLEARSERLQAQGRSPFSAMTLPDAVLRFKQGFGRLIRTREDRGRVVVLDPRLLSKGYGWTFLRALPHVPLEEI